MLINSNSIIMTDSGEPLQFLPFIRAYCAFRSSFLHLPRRLVRFRGVSAHQSTCGKVFKDFFSTKLLPHNFPVLLSVPSTVATRGGPSSPESEKRAAANGTFCKTGKIVLYMAIWVSNYSLPNLSSFFRSRTEPFGVPLGCGHFCHRSCPSRLLGNSGLR